MTTEQENKIIEQAQDIMARRFAVENELKLNRQSVAYYGAYYLGAIKAVQRVVGEYSTIPNIKNATGFASIKSKPPKTIYPHKQRPLSASIVWMMRIN